MCFLNDTFEFLLRVQPGPSGHCPVLIRPGHTIPQKGQLSNMLKKKKKSTLYINLQILFTSSFLFHTQNICNLIINLWNMSIKLIL